MKKTGKRKRRFFKKVQKKQKKGVKRTKIANGQFLSNECVSNRLKGTVGRGA